MLIVCKKYKNKINVCFLSDFDIIDGGCKMFCGDWFKCGYFCDRLCYVFDLDYKDSWCIKVCFMLCLNEYKCKYKCYYFRECFMCYIMVLKIIF